LRVAGLAGRGVSHLGLGSSLRPHGAGVLQVEVHHGALAVLHHLQVADLMLTVSSSAVMLLRSEPRTTKSLGELEDEEDGDHHRGHYETDEGPVGEHSRC